MTRDDCEKANQVLAKVYYHLITEKKFETRYGFNALFDKTPIFNEIFYDNFRTYNFQPSQVDIEIRNDINQQYTALKNQNINLHDHNSFNAKKVQMVNQVNSQDTYHALLYHMYFLSGAHFDLGCIFYLNSDCIDELILHSQGLLHGLNFASDKLKNDKDVIIFLLKSKAKDNFECLSDQLKSDKDIIYAALTSKNGSLKKNDIFKLLNNDIKDHYKDAISLNLRLINEK